MTMTGNKIPLNMSVDYISFSAHVDYMQNREFIESVKAPNLVLVHGESNEMNRLKSALQRLFEEEREDHYHPAMDCYTPRNCEVVRLHFRGERLAKAIGSLVLERPFDGMFVRGLLVIKDFHHTLIDPKDLKEYTQLTTTTMMQRQCLPYHASFSLFKYYLEHMFVKIKCYSKETLECVKVLDNVEAIYDAKRHQVTLEWIGTPANDMVADSVLAILLQIESSPASVKCKKGESASLSLSIYIYIYIYIYIDNDNDER
jgi:cleavage and polyadenylation specificity factor subunit 3